jgi:probable lipoprotein NlpC
MKASRSLVVALLLSAALGQALAEAPVAVAAPKKARARIVAAAQAYLGTPYLYGGSSSKGMDCSGLVYRTYIDTFGVAPLSALPRTARDLFGFVEPIQDKDLQPGDLVFFDTTGRLSHVGIFEGEGRFIHAASDGPQTGVIESGLGESYWSKHYAGAGRVLPPAEYLGIILIASLSPSLGLDPLFRGISADLGVSYRFWGLEAGLELRPSWDAGLGVVRLPMVLSLGLDRNLRFFAGPALTLGQPNMMSAGQPTAFEAQGGVLATVGAVWTPLRFRLAGLDWGIYGELVYDRYVIAGGGDDLNAQLHAGFGARLRWSF